MRLIPFLIATACIIGALTLHAPAALIAFTGGAIAMHAIETAVRDWWESLTPANKAQRRMMAAMTTAVRRRSLATDPQTGKHTGEHKTDGDLAA